MIRLTLRPDWLRFLLAALLGLVGSTGIALLTERLVIRPMFNRAKVVLVVGTVGVALLLIGLEGLLPYPKSQGLPTVSDVLHISPFVTRIDGIPLLYQDLTKLAMLVVLAGAGGVGGVCAVAGDGCAQARPAHASVSSTAPASSHLDLLRIGLPFEIIWLNALR